MKPIVQQAVDQSLYLTWPEQRIIGGSVPQEDFPDLHWHTPVGLLTGEISFDQAVMARQKRGWIQGVINRKRPDGNPFQICLKMSLSPLDPETQQAIDDPRVVGIEEIWNAQEGFDESLLSFSELEKEFYARYESNGLHLREGNSPSKESE